MKNSRDSHFLSPSYVLQKSSKGLFSTMFSLDFETFVVKYWPHRLLAQVVGEQQVCDERRCLEETTFPGSSPLAFAECLPEEISGSQANPDPKGICPHVCLHDGCSPQFVRSFLGMRCFWVYL